MVRMIPHYRTVFFPLAIILLVVYPTASENSTGAGNLGPCKKSCGANQPLQYPFGFSSSCPIRLECKKNSGIQIGEFLVLNITSSSIIVDLPAECNRFINSTKPLFGTHYAPTWNNSLLLRSCTSQLNACTVPTSFVRNLIDVKTCNSKSDNISCFTKESEGEEIMSYKNVTLRNCTSLFSSILLHSEGTESLVSLQFQRLELGWWLEGKCDCSNDSICTPVPIPDRKMGGFRCKCRDGFSGDGFSSGDGCQKGESTRLVLFILFNYLLSGWQNWVDPYHKA